MSPRADRRAALLDRMTQHVLAHGLGAASLRPLAAAAGTSDRMLLYYFADKDELLSALFAEISTRFARLLAASLPDTSPRPPSELRRLLWNVFRNPAAKPFLRVYLELCVAAARGEQPHKTVAAGIAEASLGWVGGLLLIEDEAIRTREAARLLAVIDGLWLFDAVGLATLADEAAAS